MISARVEATLCAFLLDVRSERHAQHMRTRRQRQGTPPAAPPVDLAEDKSRHGSSVEFLRARLKTTRYTIYALLDPVAKPLAIDPDLIGRLADLLGRSPAEVEAYYSALIARRAVVFQTRNGSPDVRS